MLPFKGSELEPISRAEQLTTSDPLEVGVFIFKPWQWGLKRLRDCKDNDEEEQEAELNMEPKDKQGKRDVGIAIRETNKEE